MSFVQDIVSRAKQEIKTIILPEAMIFMNLENIKE